MARKFEQKRWKFSSDGITYEPLSTPPDFWCSRSLLTSELVKSLKPTPVEPVNGNGTVEVSWFT